MSKVNSQHSTATRRMSSSQSENIEKILTVSIQQKTEVKPTQKKSNEKSNKIYKRRQELGWVKNTEIYETSQPHSQVKVTVTEPEREGTEKDLVCLCCPWLTELQNVTDAAVTLKKKLFFFTEAVVNLRLQNVTDTTTKL